MKAVLLVLFLALVAAMASASRHPANGHHARILLSLFEHATSKSVNSTKCPDFFAPKPFDHCCTVWDNIKCAEAIYKCVTQCEQGLDPCITCLGPLWTECCCCLDNAGIHGLNCPTCCTN